MTGRMVDRMFFLGHNFISGLLSIQKPKKTFQNFKNLKKHFLKEPSFFQPWPWLCPPCTHCCIGSSVRLWFMSRTYGKLSMLSRTVTWQMTSRDRMTS